MSPIANGDRSNAKILSPCLPQILKLVCKYSHTHLLTSAIAAVAAIGVGATINVVAAAAWIDFLAIGLVAILTGAVSIAVSTAVSIAVSIVGGLSPPVTGTSLEVCLGHVVEFLERDEQPSAFPQQCVCVCVCVCVRARARRERGLACIRTPYYAAFPTCCVEDTTNHLT